MRKIRSIALSKAGAIQHNIEMRKLTAILLAAFTIFILAVAAYLYLPWPRPSTNQLERSARLIREFKNWPTPLCKENPAYVTLPVLSTKIDRLRATIEVSLVGFGNISTNQAVNIMRRQGFKLPIAWSRIHFKPFPGHIEQLVC